MKNKLFLLVLLIGVVMTTPTETNAQFRKKSEFRSQLLLRTVEQNTTGAGANIGFEYLTQLSRRRGSLLGPSWWFTGSLRYGLEVMGLNDRRYERLNTANNANAVIGILYRNKYSRNHSYDLGLRGGLEAVFGMNPLTTIKLKPSNKNSLAPYIEGVARVNLKNLSLGLGIGRSTANEFYPGDWGDSDARWAGFGTIEWRFGKYR